MGRRSSARGSVAAWMGGDLGRTETYSWAPLPSTRNHRRLLAGCTPISNTELKHKPAAENCRLGPQAPLSIPSSHPSGYPPSRLLLCGASAPTSTRRRLAPPEQEPHSADVASAPSCWEFLKDPSDGSLFMSENFQRERPRLLLSHVKLQCIVGWAPRWCLW